MKFEWTPRLMISKEEFTALDSALRLCRDMDEATSSDVYGEYEENAPYGCDICPKRVKCNRMADECVFVVAHKALKEIIDMAVVK